jgi:HSP20 family molecular chaperone IbpA
MSFGLSDEFDERFRRLILEARRTEERMTRAMKEFEHSERCVVPLHELRPTADGYLLTIDLPGVEKEEVGLTLEGTSLFMTAPCKSATERRKRHTKELNYMIEISLPSDVETKTIKATMRNGLLALEMKKRVGGYKIRID